MQKRIDISQVAPAIYKKVIELEGALHASGLSNVHIELIKIRASQINGCAFCLNMHTQDALKQGESIQRIFLLSAWKETTLFTPEERVILQMTEEITLISHNGLSDSTYNTAVELLGDDYVAAVIMAVATINVWNRIAVSTNKPISDTAAPDIPPRNQ